MVLMMIVMLVLIFVLLLLLHFPARTLGGHHTDDPFVYVTI